MRTFDEIRNIAAGRHGAEGLAARLDEPGPRWPAASDDRWLAVVARAIFQSGFSWKVVAAKWPGFETAFQGFDPARVAMMDDRWFDRLLADKGIIRNGMKLRAVQQNAVLFTELAGEYGSVTQMISGWPQTEYFGLLELLKARGSRLGGATGQYALRFGGRDGYILSRDVVARLIAEGVIDRAPTSRRAMKAVQEAFNTWAAQSGESLTRISRVLALSTG